jgi:hypothetical protein
MVSIPLCCTISKIINTTTPSNTTNLITTVLMRLVVLDGVVVLIIFDRIKCTFGLIYFTLTMMIVKTLDVGTVGRYDLPAVVHSITRHPSRKFPTATDAQQIRDTQFVFHL